MAITKIKFRKDTDINWFAVIRDLSDSNVYFPDNAGTGHDDTYGGSAAFEAWGASAHTLADYGIEPTDDGGGLFSIAAPTGLVAGQYMIELYMKSGSNPADTDLWDSAFPLSYDGSQFGSAPLTSDDVAAKILDTPANLIKTKGNGSVQASTQWK